MGITTAMAMVPAGERPPELVDDFPWPALRAALEDDEEEAVVELRDAVLLVSVTAAGVLICVMMIVEAGCGVPLDSDAVTTRVLN